MATPTNPFYETLEASATVEVYDDFEYDYSDSLSEISEQLDILNQQVETLTEQGENLAYLPHVYKMAALLLGSLIVLVTFSYVVKFLGRVFNDNTKL